MAFLPTVGSGSASGWIPDSHAVNQMLEVVSTPEAMDYVVQKAKSAKVLVPEMVEALMQISELQQKVSDSQVPDTIWSGTGEPLTVFQAREQHQLLEKDLSVKQKLQQPQSQKKLYFDFAVSDKSEMLRGYRQEDGAYLQAKSGDVQNDQVEMDVLDASIKEWMAQHHISYQNSSLFQADGDGNIICDAQGKEQKVAKEEFMEQVTDPEKGLQKFLAQQGYEQIEVQSRPFPGEAPAVEAAATPPA